MKKSMINFSTIKEVSKGVFSTIQAVANIAVIIALIFTAKQYLLTIKPISQHLKLEKAEAYFNSGDYANALRLYNDLIKDDDPIAYNNLGYCYDRGIGVEMDSDKAKELFQSGAVNGSDVALNNLICLYFEDYSELSKTHLIDIFRTAGESKNEELLVCAIAYVEQVEPSEISIDDIRNGEYDYLFLNDGQRLVEAFNDPDNVYVYDRWKYDSSFYSPYSVSSHNPNVRYIFAGAKASKNEDTGYIGTYYKYEIWKKGAKCTDQLLTGLEKVRSIE